MVGKRPEQALLSRDTDLSKTDATRSIIEAMVDGLNDHRIDDIGQFFASNFRWMGNYGCGTKKGWRNSKIIGKGLFRQHSQIRYVSTKHAYIWANGKSFW